MGAKAEEETLSIAIEFAKLPPGCAGPDISGYGSEGSFCQFLPENSRVETLVTPVPYVL